MNRSKIIRSRIFEHEVECQICGLKSLTNIQNHIRFKHPEISIKEYMEKYDAEIMSEDAKKARAAKCLGKNKGRVQTEEEKFIRSEKNKKFYEDHPEKREIVAKRQKEIYDSGNHPLFREDVRQGRRNRMSEMNKSEEHRVLVGNHMKNIYVCSEETREKFKISATGRLHSLDTKLDISKKVKQQYIEGRSPAHAKIMGHYYSNKNNKTFSYMSSYELKYYQILDSDDTVKIWEVEPINIQYKLEGENHSYFPDILYNGKVLVEVKSKYFWYKHREMCEAKAQAAREYCAKIGWEYKIVYEDDLNIKSTLSEEMKNFDFPRS